MKEVLSKHASTRRGHPYGSHEDSLVCLLVSISLICLLTLYVDGMGNVGLGTLLAGRMEKT